MISHLISRPRRTLVLSLLFVLIAGILGGPVAGSLEDSGGFAPADSGSQRATQRIEAATGQQSGAGVLLLVATPDGAGTPTARARLTALRAALDREPGIAATASGATDPSLVAADGRSALVTATLDAGADEDLVADAVTDRFAQQPGVTLGGPLIADTQIGERVGGDLARAEMFAFPIIAVLSLLFFRRRAAWLPLLVGVTTVLGTFLALRVINETYGLSIFALNLVIGLGLGLAIDYTLFLVTRFREELAADPGEDVRPAIRRTLATAGRTVVFSSLTVAAALITLTLFPLGFLKSMGIAGATVALVGAAAALVISPALFALWGRKLLIAPKRERAEQDGAWYRLSQLVMRRPALIALATSAVMLLAALPALRAQFTPVDATVIPKAESSRVVADTLSRSFPGAQAAPVTVAITADADDRAGVTAYADRLAALPGVASAAAPQVLDDTTWKLTLAARGEPDGEQARSVVERIRADGAPFPVLVGGAAADFVDQQAAIAGRLPIALGLLALLTFLVLWAMTGSVVLPLKAIAMNALTVGASLGVLKLIYQDGRFEDVLGYTANGGIEPTDFLVASALVFALSTDYGVFLLGRIKEARDAGADEREAVAVGLQRTGRVVTAAAILLAVAIGAFSTSSISFLQQIGVATAVGVLLDAFVVRALLVPSLMALLGKWNWWAPMWTRRVHDRLDGSIGEPRTPATAGVQAPAAAADRA